MLQLNKDQGADSATRMHKRVGSLAGAADGESRNNLFQFVLIPTDEKLPSKADTEDPRVFLEEILPYGFFPPTKVLGFRTEELRVLKQAPKSFYHFSAVLDRHDVLCANVGFNKTGN